MIDLDLKDRKILFELDLDSRQSFRSIGRKVGLSKDVVSNRVKKLEDMGIIKNYYTVIDYSKLGYSNYRIYLGLQNTNPEIENEIIEYFVKNKIVFWVCKAKGPIDIEIAVWIKNIRDFDNFWEKTLQRYRKYFSKQIFSAYLNLYNFKSSYLLEKKINNANIIDSEITGLSKKEEKIDDIDYKILSLLADNSRMKTSDIAQKLNLSSITISNRVKNLVKKELIVGYRIFINFLKLGYEFYKVDITLTDYNKRNKILDFIKTNPYLLYHTKTAGYADLEFDLVVKDVNQLIKIIEEIKIRFPDTIKSYNYFFQPEIYKIKYFPER